MSTKDQFTDSAKRGILHFQKGHPSASSSSSHYLSNAITPDHTPDDKDQHVTQTPGQETNFRPETVNFPHTDVQRNSVNYCRCCQEIPGASLIFGKELLPNKGSHSGV